MESIDLVNSVRVREGMEPCKSSFDKMSDAGLEYYMTAGENIAAGYRDAIFAHEG